MADSSRARARPAGCAYSIAIPLRRSSDSVDCWDQIAKFGHFVKDEGEGPKEAVFNLEHLSQFLDNFAQQKNPLWADFNHDFGDCLARYNALALVVGGTVLRSAAHGEVAGPGAQDLINTESGLVEDGVYAHRFEVTPAGEARLPNVFYISPFFLTDGRDEQGREIGYTLLNVAWVNGPFLDGMAPLRMHVLSAYSKGAHEMADDTMKRYGVDDSATPEQMKAAMRKYAEEIDDGKKKGEDAMSRYQRFADALGGEEQMRRFMDDAETVKRFKRFVEGGGKEPDGDEDGDKREMSVIAAELGVPAKMSAIRAKVTELRFTSVPKTEIAALREQLGELKAKQVKREADERDASVLTFAKRAIVDRAWDPDDETGLVAFYKASPEAAQSAVERNKSQKTWDKVIAMQRLTAGGAPIGKPEGEPLNLSGEDTSDVAKKFDEAAKKIAIEEKVSYPVAMTRVKAKHPQLYAAYVAAR